MRLFRTALFPLVVIVLIVYLASQTVLNDDSRTERQRVAYGDLLERVESSPGSIREVLFFPNGQRVEMTLADGSALESNYPSDAAQLELQHALQATGVDFDSKGSGGSTWGSVLTYLAPFALFFAFWIFLMNQVHTRRRERGDDTPPYSGGTSR